MGIRYRALRQLLATHPQVAWYAGGLGTTVRVNGNRITFANRYLAGIARLGLYEYAERMAIQRYLPSDLPVIELGTGAGAVACLANKRLRRPADHWCLDGNANALAIAAENGRQNGCAFHTLHAAVAYDADTIAFSADEDHVAGGVNRGRQTIAVPATTLQRLFDQTAFDRCALICDIEGAEHELIRREGDLLRRRVPLLILETHPSVYGRVGERDVHTSLEALGFRRVWGALDVTVWRT